MVILKDRVLVFGRNFQERWQHQSHALRSCGKALTYILYLSPIWKYYHTTNCGSVGWFRESPKFPSSPHKTAETHKKLATAILDTRGTAHRGHKNGSTSLNTRGTANTSGFMMVTYAKHFLRSIFLLSFWG